VTKPSVPGSSCIYPSWRRSRSRRNFLLRAPRATNQWYAIAKIVGIKMCQLTAGNTAAI